LSDSFEDIDPKNLTSISSLRESLILLMNLTEKLHQDIEELKEENQELKDEISRLKGEQGKPKFKKKRGKYKGPGGDDISSESSRKTSAGSKKERKKKSDIPIDHTQKCEYPSDELPADAQFKGWDEVVSQNLRLVRENVKYLVAIWYSPSEGKTYRAGLPEEYQGQYGIELKSLVHSLYHVCDATTSKVLQLLHCFGIKICRGTVANILKEHKEIWLLEKREILRAGLSGSYTQIDSTGSREKGQRLYTQIICNDFFSVFSTLAQKSRQEILFALQGEPKAGIRYTYNEEAKRLFSLLKVSPGHLKNLEKVLKLNESYSKEEFIALIEAKLPKLRARKIIFKRVCESLALAHYHCQEEFPPVELLMCDDAPEYKLIAEIALGLCWIHDARHYNKLCPKNECLRQILEDFKQDYWVFYRKLLAYKKTPNPQIALKLEQEFDALFSRETNLFQLNDRIERTLANKKYLLLVLQFPQLPLHNNLAELAARRKVRKRDISLHTMSKTGTQLLDAMMSLVHTGLKLKVNIYEYIQDRISGTFIMPSMAKLVTLNST